MKIVEVHIDGFGKLADRHVFLDSSFNVVVGENEAGKSTLSSTILALLYGTARGEKERWRPWTGSSFSARMIYALSDGRTYEVQRDFDRDAKGVRVYDRNGNDASGECAIGRTIAPGETHLGISVEVFTNASFLAQGEMIVDGSRAERITHALARALDGGPREDAALGAIGRLEAAVGQHVGRKRATVHAPLRQLAEDLEEARVRAADMRERLRALDDLRSRLQTERLRSAELESALRRQETQTRSFRAFTLRSRLEALREVRDDLAVLSAERAAFDDVSGFPENTVGEMQALYQVWHTNSALARVQTDEAQRGRMTPSMLAELDERNSDGGSLDDEAFDALKAAAAAATAARDRATAASDRAQAARRNVDGAAELFGVLLIAGAIAAIAAVVLGFVNERNFAIPAALLSSLLLTFAARRWFRRSKTQQSILAKQREADSAIAQERDAVASVTAVLNPLGVTSIEELTRLRERALELRARKREAKRLAQIASATQIAADRTGSAFDALSATIVRSSGSRARDLKYAKELEARKRTRDGIDLRLSMLDVRRGDLLGDDEEFALEKELADLRATSVEPQAPVAGSSSRTAEAERNDLQRRVAENERSIVALETELRTTEAGIGDLAALDETIASLAKRKERLEEFEAAVELARATIDVRTKEAHQKFARRLSDYASRAFADVTNERYAEIRIDPTTLAVRVRAPENAAIVDVDRLSAGTRDQAYLVTRLAMAQMFSEGLEPAPLLLDDPFAYWDEARIKRVLPILKNFAEGETQLTIFTTNDALANAAREIGATVIELSDRDRLIR